MSSNKYRYFCSKYGKKACIDHMSLGDKYLPGPASLIGLKDIHLHIVGDVPSWLFLSDLAMTGVLTTTFYDWDLYKGKYG